MIAYKEKSIHKIRCYKLLVNIISRNNFMSPWLSLINYTSVETGMLRGHVCSLFLSYASI